MGCLKFFVVLLSICFSSTAFAEEYFLPTSALPAGKKEVSVDYSYKSWEWSIFDPRNTNSKPIELTDEIADVVIKTRIGIADNLNLIALIPYVLKSELESYLRSDAQTESGVFLPTIIVNKYFSQRANKPAYFLGIGYQGYDNNLRFGKSPKILLNAGASTNDPGSLSVYGTYQLGAQFDGLSKLNHQIVIGLKEDRIGKNNHLEVFVFCEVNPSKNIHIQMTNGTETVTGTVKYGSNIEAGFGIIGHFMTFKNLYIEPKIKIYTSGDRPMSIISDFEEDSRTQKADEGYNLGIGLTYLF